jgi:hypothetical protein
MRHDENYDDERTNRTFSFFLISVIIAVFMGFVFGCIVTITLTTYIK